MNSLSWLLYAADVTGSLSSVLTVSAIGAGIAGTIGVVTRAMKIDLDNIGAGEKTPLLKGGWTAMGGFYRFAIGAALVASIIPGKTTIYAIAASEMGERALTTPTADKAVKALNAWLDRQIAGEKEAGK